MTNKHLLPVGREPMIFNPIRKMRECGIRDILVVTSTMHMGDIVNQLGSGKEFDCEFTYRVQEEARGIAHALALAENFAGRERILVILGDNITTGDLRPHVQSYSTQDRGAKVLLRKVGDPERYGVAAIDEQHIVEIEEKPSKPKSDFAVIGYYMYDAQVWDIIRGIGTSGRDEYEITSVNNEYVRRGQLTYGVLDGEWTDAGTLDSWQQANQILMPRARES